MHNLTRVSTDDKLIQMWLHGRPQTTINTYTKAVADFSGFVNKPLGGVLLEDLQSYAAHLHAQQLKEGSIRTKLNAIKSLFSFAAKLSYMRFNTAAALRMPKQSNSLAGRILKQSDVLKLINGAAPGRDRSLLKLIYVTGMRVSEACNLRWSDFSDRDSGEVQVTILGKGSKIRTVLVPVAVWIEIEELRQNAGDEQPVFRNKKGGFLSRMKAHKIIKQAAAESGINPKVSCHFLRHSHATHALNNGAKLALVRDSLGHSSVATTDRYLHANPSDSSGNYLGL